MSNFNRIRSENPGTWGIEEEYELKKKIASKYNISFLNLTVEQGILQSVWFGPHSNLKADLKKLTISMYELKSRDLESIEVFQGGHYAILDKEENPTYIQHEVSGSSVAQCFEHRPGH